MGSRRCLYGALMVFVLDFLQFWDVVSTNNTISKESESFASTYGDVSTLCFPTLFAKQS